jgi:hypothetical protein
VSTETVTIERTTADWRCKQVADDMALVREVLNSSKYEPVHPGRWRSVRTGVEIETGYSHGEGRLRVYLKNRVTDKYDLCIEIFLRGADEPQYDVKDLFGTVERM